MKPLALCLAAALLGLSAAAAASPGPSEGHAPPVAAARHQGLAGGGVVRWSSEYVLGPDRPATLELAFPLPEGATVEPSADVAPVLRAGRLVALRVLPEGAPGGRLAVTTTQPLVRSGAEVRLTPPLAAGGAVQIVDVTGADDLRFEPLARTGMDRHVGFFAPPELPPSARGGCDRLVGYHRTRTSDDPMYVVVTAPILADEGLRGRVSTGAERLRVGALGAGAVFAGLVAALLFAQRRLAQAARVEQAEDALAAEFAKLDGR